jgi:6-phospho-3-hexuloisomerase
MVGSSEISTALALFDVAKRVGSGLDRPAEKPRGRLPGFRVDGPDADHGRRPRRGTTLRSRPCSLSEGALFVLFEVMVMNLRNQLKIGPERVGANYTNLE